MPDRPGCDRLEYGDAMDEMKSALDRALERAASLGKLSPEEMRRQKESEYGPAGENIAQRYLEHGQVRILADQLGKFSGEEGQIVMRAALVRLVHSIELEDRNLSERALEGIAYLRGNRATGAIMQDIRRLFGQYAWQQKLAHEENTDTMGKEIRDRLARAGIGGSAVAEVNLQKDESWQRISGNLLSEFGSQMEELKLVLLASLGPG